MWVDANTVTDAISLVRAAILTAGPMKQNGPTSTLSSRTALGWMNADGCRFKLEVFDVGSILSGRICTMWCMRFYGKFRSEPY